MACAARCPMVTTDAIYENMQVPHPPWFYYKAGDAGEFVKALKIVTSMRPSELRRLTDLAYEYALKFHDWRYIAEQTLQFYEKVDNSDSHSSL